MSIPIFLRVQWKHHCLIFLQMLVLKFYCFITIHKLTFQIKRLSLLKLKKQEKLQWKLRLVLLNLAVEGEGNGDLVKSHRGQSCQGKNLPGTLQPNKQNFEMVKGFKLNSHSYQSIKFKGNVYEVQVFFSIKEFIFGFGNRDLIFSHAI